MSSPDMWRSMNAESVRSKAQTFPIVIRHMTRIGLGHNLLMMVKCFINQGSIGEIVIELLGCTHTHARTHTHTPTYTFILRNVLYSHSHAGLARQV